MILRLDKMLAHLGYGSRKDVKKIIRKGEVIVNGVVCKDDDFKVDSDNDEVIVFDESVNYSEFVYIMLNKPAGVVSATFDNYKETVIDLVSEYAKHKIFPVGRLDIDTEGVFNSFIPSSTSSVFSPWFKSSKLQPTKIEKERIINNK